LTTRVLRDERGIEVTEWIGLTLVVLVIVMMIWQAFYGGPSQALKASVQVVADRYASGFEGGLGTNGPIGAKPKLPPPGEIYGATQPTQVGPPGAAEPSFWYTISAPIIALPALLQ
jgi:hypothetical protein